MRLLSGHYRQAGRQEGSMLRASYIVSLTPLWSTEWDPVFKNKTEYSNNKTRMNERPKQNKKPQESNSKIMSPMAVPNSQYLTISTR